jgi:predicted house-cleaning NTP pyrophosphatase (Maf/HAM1 superfamily)
VEHGSVSNVIGLPMESLEKALNWMEASVSKQPT